MKKSTLAIAFFLFVVYQTVSAATINITISGFTYSPSSVNAVVGDVVTIQASTFHPLVQVDQSTWTANGTTPVSGGWGTQTANYTFTITTVADIYYVCGNHAGSGMKGMIAVTAAGISQVTATAYSISLFPNPVTAGEFTVRAEGYTGGNGKILLYNEAGQLLETYALTGVSTPIRTKLPSGAYFYTVMIGSEEVHRNKFMVTLAR
jgi:plastocyanin